MNYTSLSPLSSPSNTPETVRLPSAGYGSRAPRPPRGFSLIKGTPSNVRFGGEAPHNKGRTFAQREGLRYEQRVHDVLSAIYGINYDAARSILYEDRTGLRRAIPDGLLRIGSDLVIVEIKLSHTEKAWWQLYKLYGPLCSALAVPGTRIRYVEICRSYDPAVQFPRPHVLVNSLHKLPDDRVGVLQWKI